MGVNRRPGNRVVRARRAAPPYTSGKRPAALLGSYYVHWFQRYDLLQSSRPGSTRKCPLKTADLNSARKSISASCWSCANIENATASSAWNCVSTAFAVFATTGSEATDRGRLLTRSSASCRRRAISLQHRPDGAASSGMFGPLGMTSVRQIIANRLNAKRSTRSIQGRDRSRLNALKHGLNLQDQADPEIA